VSGVSSNLALAMNYSANKIFDANLKNLICINPCLYRILLDLTCGHFCDPPLKQC
jgi:hypothetical protein